MKKFCFVFLMLIFPCFVWADSIELSCPSSIVKNKNFECSILGNTTDGVTDVSLNVKLEDGLSVVSFNNGENFNGQIKDNVIALYGKKEVVGEFTIGKIELKYNEDIDFSIGLFEVIFFNDLKKSEVSSVYKKIIVLKDNESQSSVVTSDDSQVDDDIYLSDLIIEGYDIEFSSSVYTYTVNITTESKLDIKPVVEDKFTYQIVGNENLNDGSIVYIQVINKETEDTKIYSIKIVKSVETIGSISSSNNYKYYFIGMIVLLILINIIRIINNYRRNGGRKNV